MEKYSKVLRNVIKKIKPTDEEKNKLDVLSKKTLNLVNKEVKKYNAKSMLVGSLTRNTWLPDKKEFDIFILFPTILKEKKMEKIGLNIGKKIITKLKGRYIIDYAEHPYVSGIVDGIDIDIVPCFDIKTTDQLKSSVDRTPFHVRYIEKKLPIKLSDEVRLLKQFLKANDLYGADAKTLGFSGYVCELLIIKYKSFLNLLKSAEKWDPGYIIDIEKFYNRSDYDNLKRNFKDQPLILIDPTDKKRNTAAALSANNFFKLKKYAQIFLKRPSEKMFFHKDIEPLTENDLIHFQIKRRMELIFISFNPPKVVKDILYPQLRRLSDRLENILEENKYEFKVFRKDCYTNEKDLAVVLLEMEISKLPPMQKRVGPKVFDLNDSKRFLKKYKDSNPFVENCYWVVEIKRKFTNARDKLKDTLSDDKFSLLAKGIPNFIAEELSKKFEVFSENDKIMELIKKDKNFGIFLRKYFER